jgi:uncharacterized protein (DUF433 family)
MEHELVIHSSPNILGGVPVFIGTRVPVQTLLDYLEGGNPSIPSWIISRASDVSRP